MIGDRNVTAPHPRPPDMGRLVLAAVVVGALSFVAATLATGDVSVNGRHGDWHAVTEGLYRSGQPEILGATRRAIIHFHRLDGRPGLLVVTAASRRSEDPVRLTGHTGTEAFEHVLAVDGTPVTVPIARGTRDLDLRLEASGLFRVSEIALRRPRLAATQALRLLSPIVALAVLMATWRRMAWWTAMLWAALAGVGTAALWTALVDASAALRFDPVVWDGLRVAAVALVWVAGLACARSRLAAVAAVGGTVALLHLPSLWYGFHADDFVMARPWSARELAATLSGGFDPSGMLGTYFRPLVTLTWAVDHWLWGAWTAGYHLTNLVLHATAGVALVFLLRRLLLPPSAALLGGLAWVAHPVAASTVAWVSARADSLMAIFYLSCLVAFCAPRARAAYVVLTAVLALGAKEMAVSLPLAALLLDRVLLPRDQAPARRAGLRLLILVTAAYVAIWAALFVQRVVTPAAGGQRWAAFDPQRVSDWLYAGGRPLRAVVRPAAIRGLVDHTTARVADRIPCRRGRADAGRVVGGAARPAHRRARGQHRSLVGTPDRAPVVGPRGIAGPLPGRLPRRGGDGLRGGRDRHPPRVVAAGRGRSGRSAGGAPGAALPGRRPRLGTRRVPGPDGAPMGPGRSGPPATAHAGDGAAVRGHRRARPPRHGLGPSGDAFGAMTLSSRV
jgi:hypothetical protein